MCLAVPGQIVEVHENQAVVDFQGSRLSISTVMTPEVRAGEWVLVHAGFAIAVIPEDEARKTWEYLSAIAAEGSPPDE